MKVVHVSYTDTQGGAARGAFRLHKGLCEIGVRSSMLVGAEFGNDKHVSGPDSRWGRLANTIKPLIESKLIQLQRTRNPILHSLNCLPGRMHKRINATDADVVHLQWINSELISVRNIAKIRKPIVWTLRDSWSFCGAEHHDLNLTRRPIEGYYRHNRPDTHRGLDLDRWTWRRKRGAWRNLDINLVTPSRWLADCASASMLFRNKMVTVIPDGLDTEVFKPINQATARDILGLPQDVQLILFGAVSATSERGKGFQYLQPALQGLAARLPDAELVVFGCNAPDKPVDMGLPIRYCGYVRDDIVLALLYSAADVMVVPSMQEAFGQTASESLACGTPVVAFGATGLLDIVDHQKNGYLAEPYETADLADGIEWVLQDEARRQDLSKAAREKALSTFRIQDTAAQYAAFYETVIH